MLIWLADATQIFGGRGLTVTGMGKLVENVSRTFCFEGSEHRKLTVSSQYHRTSGFDASTFTMCFVVGCH